MRQRKSCLLLLLPVYVAILQHHCSLAFVILPQQKRSIASLFFPKSHSQNSDPVVTCSNDGLSASRMGVPYSWSQLSQQALTIDTPTTTANATQVLMTTALGPASLMPSPQKLGRKQDSSSSIGVAAKTKQQADKDVFLIHKGLSASMIRNSPVIGGITLAHGWSESNGATEAFCKAIETVVNLNPILTGHVSGKAGSILITPGTFTPQNHEFVKIVDLRHVTDKPPLDLEALNPTETLQFITDHMCPLVGDNSELVAAQMKHKLPLFSATILLWDHETAAFSIRMSHAIGDGTTFFQLLKQVSLAMSGRPVAPIIWDHPTKATHEFYPPNMSKRDVHFYYGPPLMLGCAKNILTQKRVPQCVLLDKQKVTAARHRLRDELGAKDISANDVITSALCQSNPGADIFCFTESVRGIDDPAAGNVPKTAGGNFLWEIPVSREACSRPDQLRQVTASHQSGYETNQLPWQPFLSGRNARISSLASVTENVLYDGMTCVANVPFASTLTEIPLDVAMIFRFNKQHWGILHNFNEFEPSELLQELIV